MTNDASNFLSAVMLLDAEEKIAFKQCVEYLLECYRPDCDTVGVLVTYTDGTLRIISAGVTNEGASYMLSKAASSMLDTATNTTNMTRN